MRRLLMLLLGLFVLCAQLLAQNRTVTGRVTDAQGNGVPNASVTIKGSNVGTSTNADGSFTISVPENARALVVSSVGFAGTEVSVANKNTVTISLTSEDKEMTEVVVVGYSTAKKEAFTGTAKVVSAEKIGNKNVSNVSQALAGEVSGVRVINTTGQPGASATIRIRGFGSVNGNRAPLYVVDGVPYSGNINAINAADIETMTVLKDAAATAIYGSRGANGVIVVTTRTGRSKKSFIEVDGKYGTNMSLLPRYETIKSPEEYIGLSWEALYNQAVAKGVADPVADANSKLFAGGTVGLDPTLNMWNVANGGELIDPVTKQVRAGVTRKFDPENWEDYAFQASNRSEVNVRMGGGDAKTNYYTSLGYLEDKGYSINSDFKRLNARLNLNHEVKSWLTTSMNIGYANSTTNANGQESNSNSVFWFVDNIPSIYPLFLRDAQGNKVEDPFFGGYQYDYGMTGRRFGSLTNAIADATLNTVRTKRNELTGNTAVTFKFTDFLSLENKLGAQYYNNAYAGRENKFYGSSASLNGSIYQEKTELLNLNLLNMLRFNKRFGAHNTEVLAAHEASEYKQTISSAYGFNLVDNYSLELANAIVKSPTSSSYSNTNKLESYFAQLNYDYEGKYYLSGTVRRDGSSRFVGDNKWGTFGSVSAGWDVSKMSFMDNLTIVDYLKLKASYGLLGDQAGVGLYPGFHRIEIGNLNDNPSFAPPVPGNPELTWETSKMFQTGVEFRLGKFLTGGIDYYVKNTDNLLFERRVGISNGYAIVEVNDGQLRNQGLEFDLTAHLLKQKDYYLDFGVNGEHFTNKITKMPIDPSTGKEKIIDIQGAYGWGQNHSIYDFYVRNFEGVDPTDGLSTWTVYYDDANGNKQFDAGEQVADLANYIAANPTKEGTLLTGTTKTYSQATQYYVGKSAIPTLRGAFNLAGGWKGFDLSVQMLYSLGGYSYDGAYAGLMHNDLIGNNNWSVDIRNRWQKPGDVTDVPRISNKQETTVTSLSSRFITKADYLALNNVRLGYTLPTSLLSKTGLLEQATFWVSGDNLWLNTARKGFNPATAESGASDTYRYSPLSTVTVGLKVKF